MAAAASTTYFGRKNHRYFSGETDIPTPTNLTFEFNEFDVWNVASSPEFHKTVSAPRISNKSPSTAIQKAALSLPVDVPDWSMILKNELIKNHTTGNNDDDDFYDEEDLIPPHEYLARGRATSFSVHEGIGRTLKGRDLSRVRNAVWKQIGFED
ncbi:putative senescence regulator S40 [Helianthus debilis subsp. tardiflorus]